MRERASVIHECAAYFTFRDLKISSAAVTERWIARSQCRLTGSLAHTTSLPTLFLSGRTPYPPPSILSRNARWVYANGMRRCREQ